MTIKPQKFAAVIALPGPKRYEHFIKTVADQRKVWGLYDNGWALMGSAEGQDLFALWPAADYAALKATGSWSHYSPREIDLDYLLDTLLPQFRRNGTGISVFPLPSGIGLAPELDEFEAHLREELSKIEDC
jgi:hypothetical protein